MAISKYTTTIIWDHRGRTDATGKGQLEIRITYERKSSYFSTGIKVRKSEFIAGRIVNCVGADELNKRLEIIYSKVLACVNACVRDGVPVSIEYLRRQVWQVVEDNSDKPTFIDWTEKQIPLLGLKESTEHHYYTLVRRLIEYGKMQRWHDITVENIVNFDVWLHGLTKPISDARAKTGASAEKLTDSAVYNYHKCLKAVLYRAYKFGKIDENPYNRLRGEFKRGDKENVEFLTEDEMERIETLKLPTGSILDVVRDLFVFQMYTGLAYSDMQAFDFSLCKLVDGEYVYNGERIKTGVQYTSQLLPPVIRVLKKYGMKVPKVSNQDYNRHLKSIGLLAEIHTRMHTHLARHTFATYMLSNDVMLQNVKRMLGHKSIVTTQRYAKVLAKDVHNDFDKISEKLKHNKP